MTDVELAKIHSAVGTQTVQDERLLPPWVQEARKELRKKRGESKE